MLSGSCACGAVAFEADAPPAPIAFCNCRTCRKVSGTAFGADSPCRVVHSAGCGAKSD